MLSEDQVRIKAHEILFDGFEDDSAKFGTGQITSFQSLGVGNHKECPDGWYFPKGSHKTAVACEFKSEAHGIDDEARKQLQRYMTIALEMYLYVIGILYDGVHVEVYMQKVGDAEMTSCKDEKVLKSIEYYMKLCDRPYVDFEKVYDLTRKINENLHFNFGVKNLYHRMTFTSCALTAQQYGARLESLKGRNFSEFSNAVRNSLNSIVIENDGRSEKADLLLDVLSDVKLNIKDNQNALDELIDVICELAELKQSPAWRGVDFTAIFFAEFNRYKSKSEAGQVLTPEHIAHFVINLLDPQPYDVVLDATCGSGTFLVEAMEHMINVCGDEDSEQARNIKSKQLYGIEFDREMVGLASGNMLMNENFNVNLMHGDSRSEEIGRKIKQMHVTKVPMNPPYERKYGCMKIVKNVLDNVEPGALCAFIMPDKKLEKESKRMVTSILEKHRLLKVIKLPDVFAGVGVSTSIFLFEAHRPQDTHKFWACNLKDDGFVTVKNKGRQDVNHTWNEIEADWLLACETFDFENKYDGQWRSVDECLSYQEPEKPFEITEEMVKKFALDWQIFDNRERETGAVIADIKAVLTYMALYQSRIEIADDGKKRLVIELD